MALMMIFFNTVLVSKIIFFRLPITKCITSTLFVPLMYDSVRTAKYSRKNIITKFIRLI